MEEGKKEEADNCMMNPGKCSAHSVCILCKECRRHKYKNRIMVGRVIPSITQLELSNRWIY